MPLDRAHVTVASRIMLPSYVGFFAVLGISYVVTPESRLHASPSLDYAAQIMPLDVWGSVFLAVAAVMAGALLARRRPVYRYALLLAVWIMGVWTLVAFLAALRNDASPAGWAYPAIVVAACAASYRSLSAAEK